jgi:hypothetical protein
MYFSFRCLLTKTLRHSSPPFYARHIITSLLLFLITLFCTVVGSTGSELAPAVYGQ